MKLKKYSTQKSDDLSRKLKSYSALTGAFLVGAGAANAQIVYTDLIPDEVVLAGQYDVDLDNDGVIDFSIAQAVGGGGTNAAIIGVDAAHVSNQVMATAGAGGYTYPSKLAAGNPIGPGGPFLNFANASYMSLAFVYATGNVLGHFNGQSGYIGVEFQTGTDTYYGWIDCEVATGATSVTVKGYAYESTPLTAINAGATPGPSGIANQPSSINKLGNFYPNAVNNGKTFIQLEAKDFADLNIEVINGMGQVMQNEKRRLISGNNIIALNVKSLASGTYFVKLTQGDQSYFRKLLINN